MEDVVKFLEPVSKALDKMQEDSTNVAEAVMIWKELIETFRRSEGRDWLIKAETRHSKSVPASWFAANLMHPEYVGLTLFPSELKLAMEWLESEYPDAYPEVINYVGSDRDIIQENWKKAKRAKVANFMKVQATLGNVRKEFCEIACLHCVLVPSSAGMEIIFSTMGLVLTNLRNKLSIEKVQKLSGLLFTFVEFQELIQISFEILVFFIAEEKKFEKKTF